ncbi:hypothetical protein GEV33_004624 [Tenebrio molitor]|uniref:Uncharacterized protein n=1 Tax=Tenebrio molitor TaxID=7067 RepID=A0A8J6LFH1_TENMO|nr:hypothetical protein GEV33_004624 [Tenebrio molitor]
MANIFDPDRNPHRRIIQGFLFTSFTKTIFYKDVSTLEEVIQLGLPTATSRWNLIYKDSDIMRRLKTKQVDPNDVLDLVAFQRNIITFDTKLFLTLITKSKYVDDDGQPLLHIVNECVSTFKIATLVPKESAFLNVFDDVIIKLYESGLTWKWYNDMFDSIVAEKMIRISKKRKRVKSFSLRDTESAFCIIALGLAYEYWYVYQTHFLLVNFLTLQVLQTDNHIFELNKFTQTAIEVMNSYDYFIAIKIEENFLNQSVNPSESRFYNTSIRHGKVSDFNPITNEELFNIKTY